MPAEHWLGSGLHLQHQLAALTRNETRRPRFRPIDRLFWVFMSWWSPAWRNALKVIQPATVLHWHPLVKDHSLWRMLATAGNKGYLTHYYTERNHQGKNNLLLSIRSAKHATTSQFDVATGWADFCSTIIETQRELAV